MVIAFKTEFLQADPTPPAGRRVGGGGRGDGGREREGRKGGGGGRGEPGRGEGAAGRDGRVGGGLRGGVGDTVRNQRREEHLRRKQNRLLNIASNTRGRISLNTQKNSLIGPNALDFAHFQSLPSSSAKL